MKDENRKTAQGAKHAPSAAKAGKEAQQGAIALPSIKLSERDRQAGFALLAIAAVALVAYVLFFAPPPDTPSDMDTFVGKVLGVPAVSLFFDMRDAPPEAASKIYQCGVDIAGGKLFGSKTVTTYACDKDGCISANSASNGSTALTYEQVQKKLGGTLYVLVRAGAPSTKFFENHAEITLDETFNASCKLG